MSAVEQTWALTRCWQSSNNKVTSTKFDITDIYIWYTANNGGSLVYCKLLRFFKISDLLSVCFSNVQSASSSVCWREVTKRTCWLCRWRTKFLSPFWLYWKVYWNLLNCVVRTWHIHFQSQHDIFFLARTALCHVKKKQTCYSLKALSPPFLLLLPPLHCVLYSLPTLNAGVSLTSLPHLLFKQSDISFYLSDRIF